MDLNYKDHFELEKTPIDSNNQSLQQFEATEFCAEMILNYMVACEQDDEEGKFNLLEQMNCFLSEQLSNISPTCFLNNPFLDAILSEFASQGLMKYIPSIICLLEYLTQSDTINDALFTQYNHFNLFQLCALYIKEEANIYVGNQYFNIMIHMLGSFFKFGHDENEIFFDSLSNTSSNKYFIKFLSLCLYKTVEIHNEISDPKRFAAFLVDKLQQLDQIGGIDEEVIQFSFLAFDSLSRCDICNNDYILDIFDLCLFEKEEEDFETLSLFQMVMNYFNPMNHIQLETVMNSFFRYTRRIFESKSDFAFKYQKPLFMDLRITFFINIIENSEKTQIRTNALLCLYDIIYLESLNNCEEIDTFLKSQELFVPLFSIFQNGQKDEKLYSFLIITAKLPFATSDFLSLINHSLLDDVRNFLSFEPIKSIQFYLCILNFVSKVGDVKSVASDIRDLDVFSEVTNYLQDTGSSISKEIEQKITDLTTTLFKLLETILADE